MVAEAVIRLAVSPELEGVTGRYLDGTREGRANRQAYDLQARRRLWASAKNSAGPRSRPSVKPALMPSYPHKPVDHQLGRRNVILLREPSDRRIRRFLDEQRSLPFSYPEAGASRGGAPPGYPVNHHRGRLGTGQEAFARAIEALWRWKMYELGWTMICWPDAPVAEGTVVGVLGRHLGV